ncbi:activating signal cointegrator 1 complex subunit 1 isoform 10-T11 [Alca torda]
MPTGGRNRWRAPRSLFIKTSWQGLYFKEGEARRGLHLHRLSAVAPTILAPGGGGGGGKRVVTTLRMRGALPTLRAGGGLSSASAHARRPAHTPSGRGLNSATAHARPQAPPLPAFRNQPLPGPGDCADEPCDAFVVEETEKGFQCRVEVPSPLYKYIIGKKGETKKKLETETRTSISIPKPGVEGEIVITGQHRSGVVSARTRIDVLLDSFRKKQPFTHFLSFVLNQPAIQEKFLQFKEEVLEKCSKPNCWREAPDRGGGRSGVHERRPCHDGRPLCQSPHEGWLGQLKTETIQWLVNHLSRNGSRLMAEISSRQRGRKSFGVFGFIELLRFC